MKTVALIFLLSFCIGASAEHKTLKVDIYVEALCPYCRVLIAQAFAPIFEYGLEKYMDFHIYYAGNIHIRFGKLVCQHGERECYLNKAIGCGMAKFSNATEWYPYVKCMENPEDYTEGKQRVYKCAKRAGLQPKKIDNCANSAKGEKIQRAAYERTQSLYPPHKWVPWGVIDGKPAYDEIYKLLKMLCDIAPAESKPSVCFQTTEIEQTSVTF